MPQNEYDYCHLFLVVNSFKTKPIGQGRIDDVIFITEQ